MAKRRAHQRQLERARRKREVEQREQRRRRLIISAVVGVIVLAMIGVGAVFLLAGDEPSPVIDQPVDTPVDLTPPATEGGAAAAVACDGEVPPAAGEEKPTYSQPPELVLDEGTDYRATIETSCGTIEIDLYEDRSPGTVNNFVFLAREGFYEGLTFHRVIPGFVIQGGDPSGDGTGGPGYQFEDELELAEEQGYPTGTLAMANSGPDTQGSQFFIVLEGGGAVLEPLYSIFGQVTSGMDVAERIAQLPRDATDRPESTAYIEDVTIEEGPAAAPTNGGTPS